MRNQSRPAFGRSLKAGLDVFDMRIAKEERFLRYRYIAYKYARKSPFVTTYQSVWESFGSWPSPSAIIWRPPTDVYETLFEFVIVMELAGIREEGLTITLFSDLLVVEGKREQPVFPDAHACHQLGIKYGNFRAEIDIPFAVDRDDVIAEFTHGLLKIRLNKPR